jgi:hypothetical protein
MGSALDILVEFSTLGEYRLAADGALCPASALSPAPEREPRLGGAGAPRPEAAGSAGCAGYGSAARAAVRRIVAGGAADLVSAATPAARRVAEGSCGRSSRPAGGRAVRRRPAPVAPEQLCLAV